MAQVVGPCHSCGIPRLSCIATMWGVTQHIESISLSLTGKRRMKGDGIWKYLYFGVGLLCFLLNFVWNIDSQTWFLEVVACMCYVVIACEAGDETLKRNIYFLYFWNLCS